MLQVGMGARESIEWQIAFLLMLKITDANDGNDPTDAENN